MLHAARIKLALAFALPLLAVSLFAEQPAPGPNVFLVDPATLVQSKAHPTAQLLTLAKHEADAALQVPALSVTAKEQLPPSGDKHDYLSPARYYWPNPDTPDHLPYVRRDGQVNPEIRLIPDQENIDHMTKAVHALALGYYLTGDQRYADHAALLLRAWFLAPATAMHPNMNFAQYVRGENTGRGSGILDARDLPKAIDAAGMLAGCKCWTTGDDAALRQWFADYYTWLTSAKSALSENHEPNNHGSWFQQQIVPIALYLGKTEDARRHAEYVRDELIPGQIDAQGLQKYELARTMSFHYSSFNLQALTQLAAAAAPLGIDLYQPARPGEPGILTAVDALLPYDAQHKWPHPQIVPDDQADLCPALYLTAAHARQAKYAEALKRFQCKPTASELILFPGN